MVYVVLQGSYAFDRTGGSLQYPTPIRVINVITVSDPEDEASMGTSVCGYYITPGISKGDILISNTPSTATLLYINVGKTVELSVVLGFEVRYFTVFQN